MEPIASHRRYALFQELAENIDGWDLDFVQLSPTEGHFELQQIRSDRLMLARARLSAQFEQRGRPPAGYRAFALMAPHSSEVRWGNRGISPRSLIIFPANDPFVATSLSHFHIFVLAVDNQLLEDIAEQQSGRSASELFPQEGSVAHCRLEQISRLRTLLVTIMQGPTTRFNAQLPRLNRRQEHQVCSEILGCLQQSTAHSLDENLSKRQHALQRSLQLVAAHPPHQLSVGDLVRQSGASQRTLEYAFSDRFAVSPQQYLNAQRLHRAHLQLLQSCRRDITVEEIARQHGYSQSGSFARAYRIMYGQLPSKTLRREI